MFTGGTAVPGTVVSSVQEVQAASSSIIENNWDAIQTKVVNEIQNLSLMKDLVVGDAIPNNSQEYSNALDAIDAQLTAAYEEQGLTIETSGSGENKVDSNKNITIELTVTDKEGNSKTQAVPVAIDAWNAQDVLDALEVDWDNLQFTQTSTDVEAQAKEVVNTALTNAWTTFEADHATVAAKFNQPEFASEKVNDAFNEVTGKVTVSKKSDASVTATKSISISYAEANTDEKAALSYLQNNLKTVTVDATTDISADADVSSPEKGNGKAIADKIEAAAISAFAGTDYATNASKPATVTVTGLSMAGNGRVTATINVKIDSKAGTNGTFTVDLVKSDATTIVNMTLVDAEKEIETGTGIEDAVSGIQVTYANGKSETIDIKKISTKGITYDTIKWDQDVEKVGTVKTIFSCETASVPFEVQVVETQNSISASDWGFVDTKTPLKTVVSSDDSIITGSIVKGNIVLVARNAGTAKVTVTNEKGQSYVCTIDVAATGEIKRGSATPVNTTLNIAANVTNIGFVAHPENDKNTVSIVDEEVSEPTADGVVEAELTTVGDQPVIQLTPIGDGTAQIKVTGGDNGKLSAIITVTVKDHVITVSDITKQKGLSFTLNQDALDHLRSLTYTEGINPTVEELGFTSSDKLILSNGLDSVPANDITKVEYNAAKNLLVLTYNEKTTTVSLNSRECNVANTVSTLGLVATNYEIDPVGKSSIESVDFTTTVQGNPVILITPKDVESGNATITVSDELGNEATIKVTITDGVASVAKDDISKFVLGGSWNVVVPNAKQLYTIGDSVDVTDCYLVCTKDGNGYKKDDRIQLTNEMVTGFDSTKATLTDGTLNYNSKMTVMYGGANKSISYAVRPASVKVSKNSLDLASGDSIASVAVSGTADLVASLNDAKDTITIQANKVNVSGSVIVTTTDGNTVAIKVAVDNEGSIETSVTQEFETSISLVDNTEETLGIVGTDVASSDESVVLVSIAGGKVVLTSVAPGTAVVTVTDGDLTAELTVTVDEFGTITVDSIKKATEDGFMRGETITEGEYAGLDNWYYYIDGEMVTNNWVEVNENGTNVWYHFDKDGKMSRGWIIDESGWKIYNLDSNGRMRKDMWINAAANDALGMPAGLYHLQSDGAVQMNGWAESVTAGIYWYCNAGTGLFEQGNPASWSNAKLW